METALIARAVEPVRAHRTFTALMVAGIALRVVVQIAYWPAVQFPDTGSYIYTAQHLAPGIWHPVGYSVFLYPFLWTHSIALVTIAQHVMGLGCAVFLYVLLRGLRVGGPLAAVATTPFLLDPMQVYLEQYLLSDVLFAFLLVLAIFLAVRRRPSLLTLVALGGLLAAAALTRTIALAAALPIGVYVLTRRPARLAAAGGMAALVLPILLYMAAFHHYHGTFGLQGYSGRWLYGRVAPFADCRHDAIPRKELPLCPIGPRSARPGPPQYVWDSHLQFFSRGVPADILTRSRLAGKFARTVIVHQPLDYLDAVAADVGHAFAPGRNTMPDQWFAGSWYFFLPGQPNFWRTTMATVPFGTHARTLPRLRLGVARALHTYEDYVYTPGPLGAVAIVLCVAALAVVRRRRGRLEIALLGGTGLLLLILPIMTVDFDYRYVLSSLQLVVVAGALALSLLKSTLRPALDLRTRIRSLPTAAVAVAVVASFATNALAPQAYASGNYRIAHYYGADETATAAGGRYAAWVSTPALVAARCVNHRWLWRYEMYLTVQWLHGGPNFAAVDNLTMMAGRYVTHVVGPGSPKPGLFNPAVLGPAHPTDAGAYDFYVTHPERRLRVTYADPLGGGVLGWQVALDDGDGKPPPYEACGLHLLF